MTTAFLRLTNRLQHAVTGAVVWVLLIACASVAGAQPAETGRPMCAASPVSGTVARWQPPADAPHGISEFKETTQVTLPPGVMTLDVEVWAAGGGGGSGSFDTFSEGGAGGGGGASGSYSHAVLQVPSGRTYTLVVGRGGAGGQADDKRLASGADGGDSGVCDGDRPLVIALGGRGGEAAKTNARGGRAGSARAVQISSITAALTRPGNSGSPGAPPLFEFPGTGGRGGNPVAGSAPAAGAWGGSGGIGAMYPDRAAPGSAGGSGSIVMKW